MSAFKPPKWINSLLEKYYAAADLEEVQGDLFEAYNWRRAERGKLRANWLFFFEAVRMIFISKDSPSFQIKTALMLYRNYITTGFRFLKKNSYYSFFNILGLAIGISFCWLAYLYTDDEMSFDSYLPDHEKLYRIVIDFKHLDEMSHFSGSSHAMSNHFEESIPEIDQVIKIQTGEGMILTDHEPIKQSYLLADAGLVDMLQLSFVEGAPGKFDQPNDVIISESLAGKLNIHGKASGKILSITKGKEPMEVIVRGVYADIPLNTSVKSDMIVSYTNYEASVPSRKLTNWFDINMNTIIKLHDVASKATVEAKMTQAHKENEEMDDEVAIRLQPLAEIHLDDVYGHYNGIAKGGNTKMMKLFTAIGLFCLIISMINYANFNISLYIHRSREVALRKVLGAQRSGIFNQFITESVLSCLIAGALALIILILILPYFSAFVSKQYDLSYLVNVRFLIGAFSILLATAMVSGFYPALVLSKFSIVKSLKGEQKIRAGKWITQTLLGIQFMIATSLIATVLTMNDQVRYLSNYDTKIDYDNVLYMDYIPAEESNIKQFVTALNQMPEVASVAAISGYNGTGITEGEHQFSVRHLRVHGDLIDLLNIGLVQGRDFNDKMISDKANSIIVNQAFVERMELIEPIGSEVPFNYGNLNYPTIIGVVEDYLFSSAKSEVDPLVIYKSEEYQLQSVYVKLMDNAPFDKERLEAAWSQHFAPFPLEYRWLEDYYLSAYNSEEQMIQLIGLGCIVSIFLATMGLLGIVGLQLAYRIKEISIRKILGASANSLYLVTGQRYLWVITAGLSGGLIIGYALLNSWLENYAFHVDFGAKTISVSMVITLLVAVITILSQVFRLIRSNPVRYLRNE